MKIVNGIMAQLPYTPPRTQLCIVELEDVCVTTSGQESEKYIAAPLNTNDVDVNPFTATTEDLNIGTHDFGERE